MFLRAPSHKITRRFICVPVKAQIVRSIFFMTVTNYHISITYNSYDHIITHHIEEYRRFQNNDIILHINSILYISSLGQARFSITWIMCYGNHQSQRLIASQVSKSLRWISSRNFTRELNKESLLNQSPIYTKYIWSVLQPHVHLISYSRLPCCIYVP